MDFHVWAKLDPDGRIQSVQSSCTQSPPRYSPVWPSFPNVFPSECDGGQTQTNNDNSERVVPYVEKKELVYKLDAKVDEMSVIMTQLAELTKRIKVQEKLITQYEEKLSEKEKQLKCLEKENYRLKEEKPWKRKTRSLESYSKNSETSPQSSESSNLDFNMVCSLKKSCRPSSCSDLNSPCTGKFDDPKEVDVIKEHAHECLDDVDGTDSTLQCDEYLKAAVRPSSLKVGFDIYGSLSGTDIDVKGHFDIQDQCSSIQNGYSYVRKQEQLVFQPQDTQEERLTPANETEMFKKEQPEHSEKKISNHPLGHVDRDGYLDMSNFNDALLTDSYVYSLSKDIDKRMSPDNKQTEDGLKGDIDHEAIHSSWKDIRDGNVIKEVNTDTTANTHVVLDEHLEPMVCTNDYMELAISEENVPLSVSPPPLPSRRRRSKSPEAKDTCSLDRQWSSCSSSSSNSDKSQVSATCNRRTSLPVSSNTSPGLNNSNISEKGSKYMLAKTRAVFSCEFTSTSERISPRSLFDERSPNADMRKDDHLNNVLKDMRTTMEWNKAIKKLISQSHDNTKDKVEFDLRSTVQRVYEAYRILHAEKGARLKRYSKDKVMEKVKIKTSKTQADNAVSEEFIKKCLDLVISTYP